MNSLEPKKHCNLCGGEWRKGGYITYPEGVNMSPKETMFEDYLKEVHAKDYTGTDDDMPANYEAWLEDKYAEPDSLIALANRAMEELSQKHD